MEKTINKILYTVVMIIFPGIVFGGAPEEGMDMKLYTTFLSYGLLFLVFLMFSVLIYYTSGDEESEAVPSDEIIVKIPEAAAVFNNAGLAGMMKYMSIIYYAVILLIVMYITMLVFTIL